jgi:pilus assembly protein Flp/PilA
MANEAHVSTLDSATALQRTLSLARDLCRDENGQNLVEYAFVAALISLSAVYSFTTLDQRIRNAFNTIGSQLTSAL